MVRSSDVVYTGSRCSVGMPPVCDLFLTKFRYRVHAGQAMGVGVSTEVASSMRSPWPDRNDVRESF